MKKKEERGFFEATFRLFFAMMGLYSLIAAFVLAPYKPLSSFAYLAFVWVIDRALDE